ncbi:pre-mRNA-splicing factor cwc22, partial [Spiromyces aspiralis]
ILQLLLENPTDDSIEVAVGFAKQIGALMVDLAPRVLNAIFETFRSVLHEAEIDKRVQYMIEVLFQIRRDQFKDYPIIPEGLDLVDEEEQIVHEVSLDDDELDVQEELNIFKYNPNYVEDEEKYAQIRREILGDSEGEEGGDEEGESGSEESVEDESDEDEAAAAAAGEGGEGAGRTVIRDRTEAELIHLRRTIYLTVMSSAIFEEAVHKLLKLDIQPGDEIELCNMIVECCAQERTYQVYYGLIGERLCKLNRKWQDTFVTVFIEMYENIHRFEVNRLRNIAKFFGFLFSTDALPWACFSCVKLTEEDTTSSSRIFLKQVLQDISEQMGLRQLNERIKAPELAEATKGLFPNDNTRHMRFAINYFTSIGLGALTEELREWLKEAVALKAAAQQESSTDYESDNGSDSSGNDSEDYSGSESPSHSTTSQPTRSASRSSSGSESSSGEDAAVAAKVFPPLVIAFLAQQERSPCEIT